MILHFQFFCLKQTIFIESLGYQLRCKTSSAQIIHNNWQTSPMSVNFNSRSNCVYEAIRTNTGCDYHAYSIIYDTVCVIRHCFLWLLNPKVEKSIVLSCRSNTFCGVTAATDTASKSNVWSYIRRHFSRQDLYYNTMSLPIIVVLVLSNSNRIFQLYWKFIKTTRAYFSSVTFWHMIFSHHHEFVNSNYQSILFSAETCFNC